ncbi:hypothetical protein [Rhodospira trueperi]|uniref:Uncharacterized protein n=1 Tax=Rhodospira trueperi TaxID=69960 RepID=A0A1G7EMA3_9PROT|nr:hypothetical protein [Rhodospira trueperi]SDE64576.1 hypothetical protein SAMN05421720_109124 [Rhodospira trueperi]
MTTKPKQRAPRTNDERTGRTTEAPAVKGHNRSLENDIEDVVEQFRISLLTGAFADDCVYRFLQGVYTLYKKAKDKNEIGKLELILFNDKPIKANKATLPMARIIKGLCRRWPENKRFTNRISEWAKCLHVLQDEKVRPEEVYNTIKKRGLTKIARTKSKPKNNKKHTIPFRNFENDQVAKKAESTFKDPGVVYFAVQFRKNNDGSFVIIDCLPIDGACKKSNEGEERPNNKALNQKEKTSMRRKNTVRENTLNDANDDEYDDWDE